MGKACMDNGSGLATPGRLFIREEHVCFINQSVTRPNSGSEADGVRNLLTSLGTALFSCSHRLLLW